MKFVGLIVLLISFIGVSTNSYAGCNCDDWVEKGGYCVDYVKSKIPSFPIPTSVAEITVLKNEEISKVEEGDVAIFDLGRYWHVAYINKVHRDQAGQAISIDVSETNFGGKLSYNQYKHKWNQKDEHEWKRALCCGVTSKYDQLSVRKKIPVTSIEQIWSPDNAVSQEKKEGRMGTLLGKISETFNQFKQLTERVLSQSPNS